MALCQYYAFFPPNVSFSSALQSVSCLSDVRCIITAAIRLTTEWHAAEQPEIPSGPSPQQHHILTNKGEQQHGNKDEWREHLSLSLSPLICYDCEILSFWRSTACCFYSHSSYFLPCCLFFPLQGSMSSGKQGSVPLPQSAEKRPEDPRTLQQRR